MSEKFINFVILSISLIAAIVKKTGNPSSHIIYVACFQRVLAVSFRSLRNVIGQYIQSEILDFLFFSPVIAFEELIVLDKLAFNNLLILNQ